MKHLFFILAVVSLSILTISCSENYSTGERVGQVVKLSQKGLLFKSWEAQINLGGVVSGGDAGMAANVFNVSLDNDRKDQKNVIDSLQSAMNTGKRVKIDYHEVYGWNWLHNRGDTDYFIRSIKILK